MIRKNYDRGYHFKADNGKTCSELIRYNFFPNTAKNKKKFSIKDFLGKCDQIRRKLRIWSSLMKKSLIKSFIFCTVKIAEAPIKIWGLSFRNVISYEKKSCYVVGSGKVQLVIASCIDIYQLP